MTFLHYEPDHTTKYRELTFADGATSKVTPAHRILKPAGGDVPSCMLRPADLALRATAEGTLGVAALCRSHEVEAVGMYCPLTAHGTIVVDGVVYSSYTHGPHWLCHLLFTPLRIKEA